MTQRVLAPTLGSRACWAGGGCGWLRRPGSERVVVVAGGNEGAASSVDCWVQPRTSLQNLLVIETQLQDQQLRNCVQLPRRVSSDLVSSCPFGCLSQTLQTLATQRVACALAALTSLCRSPGPSRNLLNQNLHFKKLPR